MPVPWLRLLDAAIGVTDLVRRRRTRALGRAASGEGDEEEGAPDGRGSNFRGRPSYDPEAELVKIERQRLDAERLRAERVAALELVRQAGDREISRLRLLAGIAVASWAGTLWFAVRLVGFGGIGARIALGAGWILLLCAIALAFAGQARVARHVQQAGDWSTIAPGAVSSGASGTAALSLLVAGLALASLAALIA
jgi:hypothetical protein